MDVLYARVAAIDVHKRFVTCCVRIALEGGRSQIEVREFGTTTLELLALSDWLEEFGVTHLCMESTGSYWVPVWNVLEGRFELLLANAQHVKAVPGRKTDIKDAQWLAELYAHGLLSPSVVPNAEQRGLRDLTRARSSLVAERARLSNRIQKLLEESNIKLASVATDVLGVSGRAMLHALSNGQEDPHVLSEMARKRLRNKIPELQEALQGTIRASQRTVLRELLEQVESLDGSIGRLNAAIERAMEEATAPFSSAVALLETAPGAAAISCRAVLAEMGTDMTRFPSAGHLCSWAGVAPGNKKSGGKMLSSRTNPGNSALKKTLTQMAHAAARQRGTYLGALYSRIAARRGKGRAVLAVARALLTAFYHMLVNGAVYRDLGKDHFDKLDKGRTIARLTARLQGLGCLVSVTQTA